MKKTVTRFWHAEDAQDLTEYALILVLVSLATVASIRSVADAIGDIFQNAADALTGV